MFYQMVDLDFNKKVSIPRDERIIKNIVGTNLVCRNGFFQSTPFRARVISHFSDFSHLKSQKFDFIFFAYFQTRIFESDQGRERSGV